LHAGERFGIPVSGTQAHSTLDERQLGLNGHVIVDGCRGIDLKSGDSSGALDEMKRAGAVSIQKQRPVAGSGDSG
jgi:nicotinamidase-related amidase